MKYDISANATTWRLTRDRFGLVSGSRIIFTDEMQGKLTFHTLGVEAGSPYGWGADRDGRDGRAW